jgi:hypothetical protein
VLTDSFSSAPPPSASTVNALEVVMNVWNTASGLSYAARYSFDQLAADGTVVQVRAGNMIPHMSAAQRTSAVNLMDAMLAKARGSVG